MKEEERLEQISKLTAQIAKLPKGYISHKAINGKVYYYRQWSENGRKKSKYIKDDEIESLSKEIEKRKELQEQLKILRAAPKKKREVSKMQYTLMHKRTAVCDMDLDDASGYIKKIGQVYAPEHLPIVVPYKKGKADRKALGDWWMERSIPASRSGIRDALEALNINSTKMLLVKCYGLSLSDQYWICPKDQSLTWDQVNFLKIHFPMTSAMCFSVRSERATLLI